MPNRLVVSSADFIRNIGHWQSEALRQPISITHHGRERLVLAAPDGFAQVRDSESAVLPDDELAGARLGHALLTDNMDEGFLLFGQDLRVISANRAAEDFFARSRDRLAGKLAQDLLSDVPALMLADRLRRVSRTRRNESFEAANVAGQWLAFKIFLLGEGMAALFQNTTEVNVLRREREDSQSIGAALRQHNLAAVIRIDARGRIEAVDPAFGAWFGFGADEVIGHRFADLAASTCRKPLMTAFDELLRNAAPTQMLVTLLARRGEELSGGLSLAPILSDFVPRGAHAVFVRHDAYAADSLNRY